VSRLERLRAELAHAFAVNPDVPVTEEDQALVDRVARFVVARRMATPALLALETGRPLTFLGSQVAAFFGPLLTMVFARQDHDRFVRLMERRGSVDLLIETITEQENQRRG
jgi:hypothetical protein